MAKTPANNNKIWTKEDISKLKELVNENTPTRVIALKLKRSTNSIYNKASDLDLSLNPPNQSPYGTKKK